LKSSFQVWVGMFHSFYVGVNADREVQRLPASGVPIEKLSAPIVPFAYGDDHACDRTPIGRRPEFSPTWSNGQRSDAEC
jgi:hypothetical protein